MLRDPAKELTVRDEDDMRALYTMIGERLKAVTDGIKPPGIQVLGRCSGFSNERVERT